MVERRRACADTDGDLLHLARSIQGALRRAEGLGLSEAVRLLRQASDAAESAAADGPARRTH